MKKQSQSQNTYTDFCYELTAMLREIINQKELSTKDIIFACSRKGFSISQATISNLQTGKKISLETLFTICSGLEIPMSHLFSRVDNFTADSMCLLSPSMVQSGFYSPADIAYDGFLDTFQVYMFQTNSNEEILLHGELTIQRPLAASGASCSASLLLYTGEYSNDNVPKTKRYVGSCIASKHMKSMYCRLVDSSIGEICYLTYHHWKLIQNELECEMALALTTSSGAQRHPTAQRVFLCRQKLSSYNQNILRGQLRLNKSELIIPADKYAEFCACEEVPADFKENLQKNLHSAEYYTVAESSLLLGHKEDEGYIKALSLLRNYTIAPKNNKIGTSTDKSVYQLYKSMIREQENANWTVT